MFCPNCGEQLKDDAIFCGSCGAKMESNNQYTQIPIQQPTQPPMQAPIQQPIQDPAQTASQDAPKTSAADIANKAKDVGGKALNKANAAADSATAAVKKLIPGMNKKILLISCAGLLVLILALIIIFANIAAANSGIFKKTTHFFDNFKVNGEIAMFVDGKVVSTEVDSFDKYVYAYNTNALVLGNTLYKVDGNKLTEVNDNIIFVHASVNKNAVVYLSNTDKALYLYKGGKESVIYDDFETPAAAIPNTMASPNGNAVLFRDYVDGEFVTYLYRGSKPEKIGVDLCPRGISDDASVMYFSSDDALYFCKNRNVGDKVKIKTDFENVTTWSYDGKKILFTTSSATYYFSPNLGEAIKVDSGSVKPVFPHNSEEYLNDYRDFIGISGSTIKRYVLKGDSYEKYTIASSVSSYDLSQDGKNLVYLKANKLYSISTANENAEPVKLADNVKSFLSSLDHTKIYALTTDGDLIFSNGHSTKAVKISDDVKNYRISTSGVCCYVKDGVLYSTSGASKGSKVEKMNDVTAISFGGESYFYVVNDGVLYVSTNGRSFEKTKYEF
ncbi:MAG: zinc ribbon domain-containing protein [Oscillospiraceae bacterium]|nr:zinc ribbon domain-containing protein [Oscillospiraceae bacterium]